jgi:hypothetical protein
MIETTFSKLFYLYDYNDFYNNNYEMDKSISLDKYTVVFINKTENKVIILSDGLHFRPDGYTKLFPFLFDKNNSYITKIAKVTKMIIELLEREDRFKETIKNVERKYHDMEKYIISFSLGGIYCFVNDVLFTNYKKVITLNCPLINKKNDNYCSKYDIGSLLFSKLFYYSDNHNNNSKMLVYDMYKLSHSILSLFEGGNYMDILIHFHDPGNISNDETITV